jgi:hypothetical protein
MVTNWLDLVVWALPGGALLLGPDIITDDIL